MTTFIIRYCVKENGQYREVPVAEATHFRVFRLAAGAREWLHDFSMLSKANAFIEQLREDEKAGDTMSANEKVKLLVAQSEDFEWYPSTDEILEAFSKDLYDQAKRFSEGGRHNGGLFYHNGRCYNSELGKDEDMVSVGSLLDVGAGDGRVFKAIKDPRPGFHFVIDEKYGIEKARAQSDDLIRKGVFIIGRDFFQTTLIDKQYSVIYSNPPYSIYEEWTLRLLRESSFGIMYLVLPLRWETNKQIQRELKPFEYTILGEYDFLHGDRSARARVNLIRISQKTEKVNGRDYMQDSPDPFVRWINEHIGTFEGLKENDLGSYTIEENWLVSKKENKIEELVDDYNYEMNALIEGFKAVGNLPMRVVQSLGMNRESIIKIIKENISSLKDRFWRLAFDRIGPITERLTRETRENLVRNMKQFQTLDFNLDNIYSIIIWVIENYNRYTDEQTVALFKKFAEPEYIKAYKSNTRWDKDTWRHNYSFNRTYGDNPYSGEKGRGKPEKYILDYRFITHSGYQKYYREHTVVNDLIVVLRSLGADIPSWAETDPAFYGEKQLVNMNGSEIAFEATFYKNGNVHLKVNKNLMMKFNIEVARILGWVRGPGDIEDEFEVTQAEAVRYWNTHSLVKIGTADFPMLEYREAVNA